MKIWRSNSKTLGATCVRFWALLAVIAGFTGLTAAETRVSIYPTVAAAGGGRSSGGKIEISGTVGQPGAGPPMRSKNFSVTSGFWNLPALVQVAGASTAVPVTISNERGGVTLAAVAGAPKSVAPTVARETESLVVSWPTDAGGLTLESTTDISGEVRWAAVGKVLTPADGWNRVRVPFTEGQRFFRLRTGDAAR